MFSKVFATGELGLRRAINVLVKKNLPFAAIPDEDSPGYWKFSLDAAGVKALTEEGIEIR